MADVGTTSAQSWDGAGGLLPDRQLCFALTVAARRAVGAYRPVLDRLGLTYPRYLVKLVLWESSPAPSASQ